MEPLFELPLHLPTRGSGELQRALHTQLRTAILDGRLKPGVRMPSTRALAASHRIARNTVIAAYDLLLSEGYLITRHGSGTYVAQGLPRPPEPVTDPRNRRPRSVAPRAPAPEPQSEPPLNFRLGVPDLRLFPFDLWRRVSVRTLRHFTRNPDAYYDLQGYAGLREAVARHVSATRAVACTADDIVITAGAQQAFSLLARTLMERHGNVIAVENPGYPRLQDAFVNAGAEVIPIPVDSQGMLVERLPRRARIVYVTPSHQFPLGCAMSMSRRAALLEFAHRHGAVIIEDDYDCEFRFGERPLDALQTLDRSGCVLYIGTFAKTLFPALRLGFIVAPPWAREPLVTAKRIADGGTPALTQAALAEFITAGHLDRHVRRMRQIYAARRHTLLDGLRRELAQWLAPVESLAGLHLATLCRQPLDVPDLVQRARQAGVGILSLQTYSLGKPATPGLIFAYGAIDEPAIAEALPRLRRVYARCLRAAQHSPKTPPTP
jgi:GntR family transcriptional regulator/MocR family aminotransferase